MKKIRTMIMVFIMTLLSSLNVMAAQGVIRNGRTLVPVRGVFEQLGFSVNWEASVEKATLSDGNHNISIIKGQNYIKIDGKQVYPDTPQQVINGSLYLPVKAIADGIGATTGWNAEEKIVHISYNGKDSYIYCIEEKVTPKSVPEKTTSKNTGTQTKTAETKYILNTNTMKIHLPNCRSVSEISPKNKAEYSGSIDDAAARGYSPCKICLG